MIIRQEKLNDRQEIYQLIQAAFATAKYSDGNEQDLVVALRNSNSFIPELSLVAEINNQLVGHILFTKAKIEKEEILVLAPLSVKPQYQKQGIGKALIKEGHRIAKNLGYSYSIVLGSQFYYPKFGYIQAKKLGINPPKDIPSANFMAFKLQKNAKAIQGNVIYPKEFGL